MTAASPPSPAPLAEEGPAAALAPAQRHRQVRSQHSEELAQDYVEAIHQLRAAGGNARITDLQHVFGVSHVSVLRALQRLEERGLVQPGQPEGWALSASGQTMAKASAARHLLVVQFLIALGVSSTQAELDAEGMEHHLSAETLAAMAAFIATR